MEHANDAEYFVKREHQARELASASRDPQIRKIHLEMAERYAKLSQSVGPTTPMPMPMGMPRR